MRKYKLIVGLGITLCYGVANATLGGSAGTVNQDYQALNASSKVANGARTSSVSTPSVTKNTQYEVYTFVTNNGTNVRQYVNDNKVFAIKWSAKKIPNLNQLYGEYFSTYTNTKVSNTGMSQVVVNSSDFSAGTHGIAGAYSGYAVLNSQMPAGLTINNLK